MEANIAVLSNQECVNLDFGYIRETHICAGWGYPNVCAVSTHYVSCMVFGWLNNFNHRVEPYMWFTVLNHIYLASY